jgi:AcrR family transcriptional regulator
MTDTATVSRAERRKAETRARLLTAAAEVIAEAGVDGATISAVTARADVGLGTFYLHFVDKDDVVRAVGEALLARVADAADQGARTGSLDPLVQLRGGIRAVCRVAADEAALLHALYRWGGGDGTGTLRDLFVRGTADVLARAMDIGELPAGDAELAAHAVLGLCAESIRYWAHSGSDDWEALAVFLDCAVMGALTSRVL